MKNSAYKRAFTLIEMLIVIVIIGILAAALIPRLQSVQARARDTKRKTDLRTVYTANEVYLTDNGKYAQAANGTIGTCAYGSNCYANSTNTALRISGLQNYVTSLPLDPINSGPTLWGTGANTKYAYIYGNVYDTLPNYYGVANAFDLIGILENPQDPDRCAIKNYKSPMTNTWCQANYGMYYEYNAFNQ